MADVMEKGLKKVGITVSKPVLALITLIFGILVIAFPQFLSFLVGLYFIIQGALLFFDYHEIRSKANS